MKASPVVGQVTGFFLIASQDPAQSEIDIELTGLNNSLAWMNVWYNHDSKPTSIPVSFDNSKDWHTYMMEWRKEYVVWSIDGQVVLNRTDVKTTPPDKTNYRLAINSWAQVQPETKLAWAGAFKYPETTTTTTAATTADSNNYAPIAQFRNLKYRPAPATQFLMDYKQGKKGKNASVQQQQLRGSGKKIGNINKDDEENDGEELDDKYIGAQHPATANRGRSVVSNAIDMSKIAFDDDGEDVDDGSGSKDKAPVDGTETGSSAIDQKFKNHQRPKGPKRIQYSPSDFGYAGGIDTVVGEGIAQQWF